jgi:hypothetical protein
MNKKLQVLDQLRQGCPLRVTNQDRIKSRTKACLHVVNAKAPFPSHSGIAYFAKVGFKNDTVNVYVLNERACLDNLYICNACDAEGVPDLMGNFGKHTMEHHLIRCLRTEKTDDEDQASPTEQRLTSIEGRLDGLQTHLDDLTNHMGDLTGRIGNIEQLLHRLVGAAEGRAA